MTLKLKIEIEGEDEGDLESALQEVKRLVLDGFTSGFDSNETGAYEFEIANVPKQGPAYKVPYKVGDTVHLTCSPRTKYLVHEIVEATDLNKGGAKITKVRKDGKEDNPFYLSAEGIIEWRKANMVMPPWKEVFEALSAAEKLWKDRADDYLHRKGDQGTCVLGAGIEVLDVLGKRVAFINAPGGQGSLTWETSEEEVVAFLREKGLDAKYCTGRMD